MAAPVVEVALKVNYVSGEELTSLKWSHGVGFK